MRSRLVSLCVALSCVCAQVDQSRPTSRPWAASAAANEPRPLESDHEIVVLLFVATDCPISNRYAPVIRQLAAEAPADRVALWLVYADADTTDEAAGQHREAFELPLRAVLDHSHRLVRLAGATTVPEAAVFVGRSGDRRLVYRGRIDDRFPTLGTIRTKPTRLDLKCVLDSILNGQVTVFPSQPAVGCPIANLAQFKQSLE
jgi:hypothetical protein